MKDIAPRAIAVTKALDQVLAMDRGQIISILLSRLGSFQSAEDALQEAAISALGHWGRSGVPTSPKAWLLRVALNKGIDRARASIREGQKAKELTYIMPETYDHIYTNPLLDERLSLIFACCHPALEEKSRVALTLRTVCSLTTKEIADAFLDSEATLGQRISRAKAKIQAKGIPFAIPEQDQWPDRLQAVLATIYLIFTTSYVALDKGSRDLADEALFLLRLLNRLRPNEAEIEGALALVLLTQARRRARIGKDGASVPIDQQDRTLWDQALIEEGQHMIALAVARKQPGPFQVKAAIADCHMVTTTPDWAQISLLYETLWIFEPTPVVALNWAVVMGELGNLDLAYQKIRALEEQLGQFQPWHAAHGEVLQKMGEIDAARNAIKTAIEMAPNKADRLFLEAKLASLTIS